jgi:hypothetical protein
MVFYDYSKMWILSGGDSKQIVRYFQVVANKTEGYEILTGDSFILNESVVTKNPLKLNAMALAEYLGLCALRPFKAYKYHGITDLPLELFPSYIPKQVVEESVLVKLEGSKVLFPKEIQ